MSAAKVIAMMPLPPDALSADDWPSTPEEREEMQSTLADVLHKLGAVEERTIATASAVDRIEAKFDKAVDRIEIKVDAQKEVLDEHTAYHRFERVVIYALGSIVLAVFGPGAASYVRKLITGH